MLTKEQFEAKRREIELQNQDEKTDQQRYMAGIALGSMIGVVLLLFTPFVSPERIEAIGPVIQTFLGANAAVVATFFGSSALRSRSHNQNSFTEVTTMPDVSPEAPEVEINRYG
jgi:lipid-binding SYLF domain-containing protein